MRFGALAVSLTGGSLPQDLDLDTIELFLHFFSAEELITEHRVLDLSVREVTMLKAILLQAMARQIAEVPALRDAVRDRVRTVAVTLASRTGQAE